MHAHMGPRLVALRTLVITFTPTCHLALLLHGSSAVVLSADCRTAGKWALPVLLQVFFQNVLQFLITTCETGIKKETWAHRLLSCQPDKHCADFRRWICADRQFASLACSGPAQAVTQQTQHSLCACEWLCPWSLWRPWGRAACFCPLESAPGLQDLLHFLVKVPHVLALRLQCRWGTMSCCCSQPPRLVLKLQTWNPDKTKTKALTRSSVASWHVLTFKARRENPHKSIVRER